MGKENICVAIDVGGTNSRAAFWNLSDAGESALFHQRVSTKDDLKSFISTHTKHRNIYRCAIGFGGPVISRAQAQMTNWPGGPVIDISDLYDWGLPKGTTLMLNDMEAGAFGVISLSGDDRAARRDTVCLHDGDKTDGEHQSSNKILLAPGTGFGTIGIVAFGTKTGESFETPTASEIQHSTLFPLDSTHRALIAWLSEKDGGDRMPSWEDFVSGRGLINIYEGLAALGRIAVPDGAFAHDDRAAWIAANAVTGSDAGCEEALDIYYRCMGKAAQLLALAYLPFGGIYISGESTIRNLSFITKSRFVSELHDNARLGGLLQRFPVYVITQKELNIRGALWASRERIHLSHGFQWR